MQRNGPPPPPIIVWLDLEMTGLNPDTCAIVQMAIVLTDVQLNELAPPLNLTIWQPEEVLARMSPFVRAMHEKSGLLGDISKSEVSVEDAEQEALGLISAHAPYRSARLAGNSIHQDRRFLCRYMPVLEGYLHYRQWDVSTLKEIGKWWHQVKYQKAEGGQHTALFDVKQSIEEMRFYRRTLLANKTE